MLSDNNYPPLLLAMWAAEYKNGHAVFLYKENTGFGALGNTPVQAIHSSVEDVITEISRSNNISYEIYNVVNLDERYPNREWIYDNLDLLDGFPMPGTNGKIFWHDRQWWEKY